MNYNWILFLNDIFSEDFKEKMSNELKEQIDLLVGKDNVIDAFDFQMIIGISDLNMHKQLNNTFINADFILPTSESIPITIGWGNKETKDLISLNDDRLTFFWTSDLPIEIIKSYINSN